ncbi:MAG: hypothetical protein JW889_08420 [Verrucomicrobia bacterium]|nr:hypothetical protein [Verrucomicrobiota bacterium]
MAEPESKHKRTWLRRLLKAGAVLGVILLVGLTILFFVDRHRLRNRPAFDGGVLLFMGEYMDQWPFAWTWEWVYVTGEPCGYKYDGCKHVLRLRLRGSDMPFRTRAFRLHVERLPDGLLDQLSETMRDRNGCVLFAHFGTLFGDSRDDSGGYLTIARYFRPQGEEETDFDLINGTSRSHKAIWGRLRGYEFDEATETLRITLCSIYGETDFTTVEMKARHIPDGLFQELALVNGDEREGESSASLVFCCWRDRPEGAKRWISVKARAPDAYKVTGYCLDEGSSLLSQHEVTGFLRARALDEEHQRLELTLTGKKEGAEHTVCFEPCVLPDSLLPDLDAMLENPGHAEVACRVSRSDGRREIQVTWLDEETGEEKRSRVYDLGTGTMRELPISRGLRLMGARPQ